MSCGQRSIREIRDSIGAGWPGLTYSTVLLSTSRGTLRLLASDIANHKLLRALGRGFAPLYVKAAGDPRGVLGTVLGIRQYYPSSRQLRDRVRGKPEASPSHSESIYASCYTALSIADKSAHVEALLYLSRVVVLERAIKLSTCLRKISYESMRHELVYLFPQLRRTEF
jgi:hypothetical protein